MATRPTRFMFYATLFVVVLAQNLVNHPVMPVELGRTAKLKRVSHNYYVIYHTDARTPPQTPSRAAVEQSEFLLAQENAKQHVDLKGNYLLEHINFPERAVIPTREYQLNIPEEYMIGLIVDPCKGKEPNCCMGKYGTPEYRINMTMLADRDRLVGDEEIPFIYSLTKDEYNVTVPLQLSRRPDDSTVVNDTCQSAGKPYPNCVSDQRQSARPSLMSRQQKTVYPVFPDCWDHNSTVVSGVNCTLVSGDVAPTCFQVAFTSTTYIAVCEGDLADSDDCGTFVEVHMTPEMEYQVSGVKIYEDYMILPIQCPGFRCVERFVPGQRFMVQERNDPKSKTLFGPVTVKFSEERGCDEPEQVQNKHFRQQDTIDSKKNCRETWVFWSEPITGTGYESCALLYNKDTDRYDHDGFFCTPESIDPFFVRDPQAAVFLVDSDEDVLAATKITQQSATGYITTTVSSLFHETEQKMIEDPKDRKILCERDYQLWWVQRTGHKHVVQRKKGFRVASPPCEYNKVFDKYYPYAYAGNVSATLEKEHIVKDSFLSNDRQWHAPTRLIDPQGNKVPLPAKYQDPKSPCPKYYLQEPWPGPWPEHCYDKEEQHKNYNGEYFFDH